MSLKISLPGVSAWELSHREAAGDARLSEITLYISRPPVPERTLSCPVRHREIVQGIYAALNEPVRFLAAQETAFPDMPTELFIESGMLVWGACTDRRALAGPRRCGGDRRFLRRFCVSGVATVLLQLRLADSAVAILAERFERLGFSFSGVFPAPQGAMTSSTSISTKSSPRWRART